MKFHHWIFKQTQSMSPLWSHLETQLYNILWQNLMTICQSQPKYMYLSSEIYCIKENKTLSSHLKIPKIPSCKIWRNQQDYSVVAFLSFCLFVHVHVDVIIWKFAWICQILIKFKYFIYRRARWDRHQRGEMQFYFFLLSIEKKSLNLILIIIFTCTHV